MRVIGTVVCVLVPARCFVVVDIMVPVMVPIVNGRPRMINGQVHKDAAGDRMPQHRGNEENNRGERAQRDEHADTLTLRSRRCQTTPPYQYSTGVQSAVSG